MMIFKTIDTIFKSTRYGVWALALLGIPCCIILVICNFSNGIAAMMTCFSALLITMAISLLLLPNMFMKNNFLESKRMYLVASLSLVSLIVMGITYFAVGTFPELNLIFI